MADNTPTSEKKYLLGIVGDARSLASFWNLVSEKAGTNILAELGVQAAALPDADNPPKKLDMGIGVPVYAGFREMLYMHPDINLVIETTGDRALSKAIRKSLPEHVVLVERAAASFFIHLMTSEQRCTACKIDHFHTQTLLTTITDQLKEDILFLDAEGTVLSVNQKLCNKLNLNKRLIIGRHFKEFFTGIGPSKGPNGQSYDCPFTHALETQKPTESVSNEVDADGHVHYYRVYMYPIFYSGKLNRMVAMRRDITTRTELEQRLHQSRKLASIGELSTYIAHEIRNPVFAISGFANSLLRGETQDEHSREKLHIILEESKRLDDILKAIINFTRPAALTNESIDLNQAVENALEALGPKNQNIDINLDLGTSLAHVSAAPAPLKQCIINLLKNGLEAMPESGTLSITTSMNQEYVVLTISDTGIGIPADIRDQLFSPFFSTKGKSTGLGLAMTRKIMDDIGGEVGMTSTEGQGSTFTLLLPPVLAVAQTAETA